MNLIIIVKDQAMTMVMQGADMWPKDQALLRAYVTNVPDNSSADKIAQACRESEDIVFAGSPGIFTYLSPEAPRLASYTAGGLINTRLLAGMIAAQGFEVEADEQGCVTSVK
jgi:hypothetical protein